MTRQEALQATHAAICGERPDSYGPAEQNFSTTAKIWTAILERKGKLTADLDAHDVALCMVGLKLAREAFMHKDDSCVDGAGYFVLAAEVFSAAQQAPLVGGPSGDTNNKR